MEEKDFNELMDLVPSHVITEFNLTQKQTIVLGQLIMLNGLDYQKENGYFYRSNKDLAEDCGVTTTGLLKILNKLINCMLVERKTGNRKDGASLYKLNTNIFENNTNKIENIMKEQVTYQVTQKLPNELPIKIIDYLSDSLQVIDKLLNSYLTQLPNEVTHQVTSDTESDIDKEIDIYNKINNIKETINNNLNKINNNILNISESVVTTENENELDSTEFENEEEQDKLVHKMQALQVEDNEEINDSIPSEDEVKETMLADEQIEIPSEQGYIDINLQDTFETSVQESLDNYTPKKDDDQLTEEALDDIFGDEPLKEEVVKPMPTSPAGKQISIEDAKETFIPRMHQVYTDCKTKDDINTAYNQIIDGIENFYTQQRYKADTYNYLKQQAWFIRSKYEIPLYRKAYDEQKVKEATESVKSVAA